LIGNDNDNLMVGHHEGDVIYGNGGNDCIYGGHGNDALYGGDGNDRLNGGMGADNLYGGAGSDTFVFSVWSESTDLNNQRDTIHDFSAGDFIDLSSCGISSMNQIEIETLGAGDYRVHVHSVIGDPRWDLGIDVVGVAPTEANFIFA